MAIWSRSKKVKYPIRWVSYKSRLEEDMERALQTDGASELFSNDYFKSLSDQVVQQDAGIIKVQILAFTIYAYLALAYAIPDTSLSLFGLAIKGHPGVREVLLVLASSTIPVVLCLATSRDLLVWTGEKAASLVTAPEVMPFRRFLLPTSFGFRTYVGRQFEKYLFPTLATKTLHVLVCVGFTVLLLFMLFASLTLTSSIIRQIWNNPALEFWSYATIAYTLLAWILGFLWLIRFYFPLPYRDSGVLLKLEELKDTDPEAHRELLLKTFG